MTSCAGPGTVPCASGQSCHGTLTHWSSGTSPTGVPLVSGKLNQTFRTCRLDALPCGTTTCASGDTCFDLSTNHDTPTCHPLCDPLRPCPQNTGCGLVEATATRVCLSPANNFFFEFVDCASAPAAHTVGLKNAFQGSTNPIPFTPPSVVVKLFNDDTKPHTASSAGYAGLSDYPSWTTGVLQPGESACLQFNGQYHESMRLFFDALDTAQPKAFGTINLCGAAGAPCTLGSSCCNMACDGTNKCHY